LSLGMPEYEIRCFDCNVVYPPGTRRCLYCGGRPGSSAASGLSARMPAILRGPAGTGDRGQGAADEVHPAFEEMEFDGEVEDEPESRKASIAKLMGNLVWIGVLIAVSVYRACAG
jgi:hypothetical protein